MTKPLNFCANVTRLYSGYYGYKSFTIHHLFVTAYEELAAAENGRSKTNRSERSGRHPPDDLAGI